MPSKIAETIGLLMNLRQLQLQQAAQELQRQQLGISQQNSQTGALSGFQDLLAGMTNPSQFAAQAPAFTEETGQSAETLTAMAQNTAGRPGAQQDALQNRIIRDSLQYYENLPVDQQQPFLEGYLTRLTKGMSPGDAARDATARDWWERLPKEAQDHYMSISTGLAPSATDDARIKLSYDQFRHQARVDEMRLAQDQARLDMGLQAAQSELSSANFNKVVEISNMRSQHMENMRRAGGTVNAESMRSNAEQINIFNNLLRQAAPTIYGKGSPYELEDFPLNKPFSTTGFQQFMKGPTFQPLGGYTGLINQR